MRDLTYRQGTLLKAIIKEHIKTAEPVGSELLVDKYKLNISSATVRNEMLELDRKGYLAQPHTSAGRIPTEPAYNFFLADNFEPEPVPKERQKKLQSAFSDAHFLTKREQIKDMARKLAEASEEFVLTAFADNDFYYTGLTNLFSQPEFQSQDIICNISAVIDHLDKRLSRIFDKTDAVVQVYIGSKNPIERTLSLITVKVPDGPLLAMLGPMRMDYSANVALIEYCRELIL